MCACVCKCYKRSCIIYPLVLFSLSSSAICRGVVLTVSFFFKCFVWILISEIAFELAIIPMRLFYYSLLTFVLSSSSSSFFAMSFSLHSLFLVFLLFYYLSCYCWLVLVSTLSLSTFHHIEYYQSV